MSSWSKYRDKYVKPAVTYAVAGPVAGQLAMADSGGGSDIPGVDEARGVYEGITGQTAADAARDAAAIEREGMEYAADIQKEMYDIGRADQMPWLEAGGRALAELESMMGQAPTFEDYQQSDYSKFIQEQGLKELEAKSRAGGYYNTGATSKEMMQYAQDIAGQDYQQFLGNYYQSLNPYMQMAGLGQQQAQTLGQQGMQTGSQMGQYGIGSAQATAGGIRGAAQAQSQGIQNILGTTALLYGMSR